MKKIKNIPRSRLIILVVIITFIIFTITSISIIAFFALSSHGPNYSLNNPQATYKIVSGGDGTYWLQVHATGKYSPNDPKGIWDEWSYPIRNTPVNFQTYVNHYVRLDA